MLENLNSKILREHLHTAFQIHAPGDSSLTVELFEVTDLNTAPQLEQFSVIFHGPKTPVLPQGTYPLEHAALGRFDLFLVPIGPAGDAMRYQASFNRFRQQNK